MAACDREDQMRGAQQAKIIVSNICKRADVLSCSTDKASFEMI